MFTNNSNGFFHQDGADAGQFGSASGFGNKYDGGNNGGFKQHNANAAGQNSLAEQRPKRKIRIFTPVTLKMVQDASPRPDDMLEIDGEPVNDVVIVGRLVSYSCENMRTLLEIVDSTGAFKVIFYGKGDGETPQALKGFDYEPGMYAKLYGQIRIFKEEKALIGTGLDKITEMNDVTNHYLKVFTAHCVRKEGMILNPALKGGKAANNRGMSGNGISQMSTGAGGADFTALVLDVMRQHQQQHGSRFVNKNDVWASCQNKMSHEQFAALLRNLEDDGNIFPAGPDAYGLTE